MKKKRRKKSKSLKLLEYYAAYLIILIARIVPFKVVKVVGNSLGDLLFFLGKKRRNIAIENLGHAFKGEKSEEEIRHLARQSCGSFFLSFLEIIKLRFMFTKTVFLKGAESPVKNLVELFRKAKKIHDESGGCIFVAPHIGNWEIIPHICSSVGIPVDIVARPLDNEYVEKLIYADRTLSGQALIPKKNALFALRQTLKQGRSIGMLPDQSTMKGLLIDFFGRKATTTPVPAILALSYKRPVVVLACCRKEGDYQYEGFVSDPIWPGEYTDKKDEIKRITEEMTRRMESVIRKYPGQYLWIHNRWKTYKGKKEFLS